MLGDGHVQPSHRQTTTQEARRAIEALRSGVPSRHAVLAVGSNQPDIEQYFRDALGQAMDGAQSGTQPAGILISGGFGAGKSHVLDYLQQVALAQNFVCSKVVISKETPLHKPDKLYAAAIENAKVPGAEFGPPIEALTEALEKQMRSRSDSFDAFAKWVRSPESGISDMFAATVHLFEQSASIEGELVETIRGFWAGQQKIPVGEIKKGLRKIGAGAAYRVKAVQAAALPHHSATFMNHLIRGAGFAGWVLLLDEVELISKFSKHMRGRSYGELARWLGKLADVQHPSMVCVAAITDDFAEAKILHPEDGKPDLDHIPTLLNHKDPTGETTARAQAGMNAIANECKELRGLDEEVLKKAYEKLKGLHGQAYGWQPPDVAWPPESQMNVMRRYVRWWVNSWDIRRLYPDVPGIDIGADEPRQDYEEDQDMEKVSETDGTPSSSNGGA